MNLSLIRTLYNGYTFRSRYEARWAMLFDKVGWHYEYEPEAFLLKNGEGYLPDFIIWNRKGAFMGYVEVKPIGGELF